ncbi:MAG: YdiU family protein [Wenzhouxiangella sp.]|nr:YdiU family protein [Wenzhouxiangella sp.]MCH8478012.1 YdiU family protein [Wenzhouxiangella sp.]TVR96793.1 MAG: YdiU family protein [Wenzhouxiangellaceae bacterium]
MPASPNFDNSYARLPSSFYRRQLPVPVAAPSYIAVNEALAETLGIAPKWLASDHGLAVMAGNTVPDLAEPLAMAYGGHQFGQWVPQLGDGRALLLGEVIGRDGIRRDLHLKGAGPTPFSRGGDGRSSIGPVVREYLACEAMAALGIPSTRALAAVSTGEMVLRERPEPGGILCRVASSHVRVGTFEYFARAGRVDDVRQLADHVIARNYPDLLSADQPYQGLLEQVIARTARLVSSWMLVGFIHGVMNTDNTSIVGETIDFGPFGFLDEFAPDTAYSYIDRRGRYAYNQQPAIAHWNLARLAECLLPLFDEDQQESLDVANALLGGFKALFERAFHQGLVAKLGLLDRQPQAVELALDLLDIMQRNRADMTLTFRRLGDLDADGTQHDEMVRSLFDQPEAFDAWAQAWRQRLAAEAREPGGRRAAMRAINPAFILRNHLAQRAVDAAIDGLDFEPMKRLARVLARPFDDQVDAQDLALPPASDERVTTTFCGT